MGAGIAMMEQDRKFSLFYIFRVCAGVFLGAASLLTVLGMEVRGEDVWRMAVTIGVLLAVWIAVQLTKGKKRILFLGIYLAVVLAVIWMYAFPGMEEVVCYLQTLAKSYYENGVLERMSLGKSGEIGVWAITFLYGVLISYRGKWKGVRILVHVPAIFFFLLPFLVGLIPKYHIEIVAALYMGFWIIEEQKKKTWAVVLVAGVALIGQFFIYPLMKEEDSYLNDIQSWIKKEIFREDEVIVASGGVSDGKVGQVDRLQFKGFLDMTVTLSYKPLDDVFLQGFVGSRYENNEWKQQSGWDFGLKFSESKARKIKNMPFEKAVESEKEYTMDISVNHASVQYQYMPYYAKYTKTDSLVRDSYVEGIRRDGYDFDGAYGGEGESPKRQYTVTFIPMERVSNIEVEEKGKLLKQYEDYVDDVYLEVPDYLREDLQEIADEVQSRGTTATINNIQDYLAAEMTYTLNPGRTPRGRDSIEYFLLENKQGYCVHFSSAAVMLMRMNGIPARFVSGYKVPETSFESTHRYSYDTEEYDFSYYQATVLDSRAHAWAEYYVEGFGWVPVEVTPGIGAVATGNSETQVESPTRQPDRSKQQENESSAQRENETETKSEEPEKNEQVKTSISLNLLYVVLAIVFLIFLLKLHQIYRRNLWRAKKKKGVNEKVRLRFCENCELLRRSGLVKKNQSEEAYWNIGAGLAGMEEVYELQLIVEKANFGRDNLTREEYTNIERYLRRVKKSVFAQCSRLKRIKLRWWLGF